MTDAPPERPPPTAGLCHTCRHARVVRNDRGSVFTLCALSRVDPRFKKYPPLPVTTCAGFSPPADSTAKAPED